MDALATGAMASGGEVIGVITEQLQALEVGRSDLSTLHVVATMRERKAMMADLADAFIALPGGYGTLEELFEVVTLTQLRVHLKPVGLLNVNDYFHHLLAFLGHAVDEGFIRGVHHGLIGVDTDLTGLLAKMSASRVPRFSDWLEDP